MMLVQLVTRLQRRGAEVFACQLSDELAGRGHDVVLMGLYQGVEGALAPRRARAVDLGGRRHAFPAPALIGRLAEQLAEASPDLVQANGSDTLAYAVLARRRLGAGWPLVYRNIGMASAWTRRPGRRLWNRALLRGVDRVISVSEASARDFARVYRFAPARMATIPRGTACPEPGGREERRRRLAHVASLDPRAPILVHVGSFTPEKNHHGLVAAFARVRARRLDARLVLIGEGSGMAAAQAAARELGVEGAVSFLGFRSDADELAGGADVFLLPSLTEGLPGVVLEAAAREVPAVAWDVGGVREAIEDGRTGFVTAPGDMDAFVERVTRLVEDPALARRMGSAARDMVRERFDIARIAAAFEDLYQNIIACAAASST